MLKVKLDLHNQSKETLKQEALRASHPRTRERLMALYEICEGKSATQVARESNRNPETVMSWVHKYNQEGYFALKYQHSGGRTPFLWKQSEQK